MLRSGGAYRAMGRPAAKGVVALFLVVGLTGCADVVDTEASLPRAKGQRNQRLIVRTFTFSPPWEAECTDESCAGWEQGPDAVIRVRTPAGPSRVRFTVTATLDYDISTGDSARVRMIAAPLTAPAPMIILPPGDYPLTPAEPEGSTTLAWSQGRFRAEARDYSFTMDVHLEDGDGDGSATISGRKLLVIVAVTWT
ncbi:MAG: hypothetical protein ACRDIX_05080 [Actinomycetota bacterium]